MPENTISMWPELIRPVVQSPQSILVEQADALERQTNGVLIGKVNRGSTDGDDVILFFSIIVPDLAGYRHRIMVVQHKKGMDYPSTIDAEVFRRSDLDRVLEEFNSRQSNRADNDKQFRDLVKQVLNSPSVVSVAQSLIARVNDIRAGKTVDPLPLPEDSSSANKDEGIDNDALDES